MTIGFVLNGEDVVVTVEPNQRLVDILREEFGLTGSKSACHSGYCGACTVLYNNALSPSCLIPAFRLRGARVVTLEGFAKSDAYRDITQGFKKAGVEHCGYCTAGKIFISESLLRQKEPLSNEQIARAFDSIKCRCTDSESFIAGVFAASEIRKRRLSGGNS
jgi:carbon-monoxide dehydrogenase small subunit